MEKCDISESWCQIHQDENKIYFDYNGCSYSIVAAGFDVDGHLHIHTRDCVYKLDKNKCSYTIDAIKALKLRFPEL